MRSNQSKFPPSSPATGTSGLQKSSSFRDSSSKPVFATTTSTKQKPPLPATAGKGKTVALSKPNDEEDDDPDAYFQHLENQSFHDMQAVKQIIALQQAETDRRKEKQIEKFGKNLNHKRSPEGNDRRDGNNNQNGVDSSRGSAASSSGNGSRKSGSLLASTLVDAEEVNYQSLKEKQLRLQREMHFNANYRPPLPSTTTMNTPTAAAQNVVNNKEIIPAFQQRKSPSNLSPRNNVSKPNFDSPEVVIEAVVDDENDNDSNSTADSPELDLSKFPRRKAPSAPQAGNQNENSGKPSFDFSNSHVQLLHFKKSVLDLKGSNKNASSSTDPNMSFVNAVNAIDSLTLHLTIRNYQEEHPGKNEQEAEAFAQEMLYGEDANDNQFGESEQNNDGNVRKTLQRICQEDLCPLGAQRNPVFEEELKRMMLRF